MTENTTYDQLKTQRHLSLEWRGINSTQICFEKSCFSFKKDHVTYTIEIAVIGDEKKISISVDCGSFVVNGKAVIGKELKYSNNF